MYLNSHDDGESATVPVPNQGKPNTTPAAAAALENQEPGSEFQRKVPRAIQDIVNEINAVRQELGRLYVEKWGPPKAGPTRGTFNPYPPITLEDIARDRRMNELERQEEALRKELNAVKYAAVSDSGQPYQGEQDGNRK